ncbi:TipAS antibiotic-recognition domain-containing protein [Herbiconiux sp. 11R-BC]|uniref:MerR family transcriptional regulator n=1 Tax=Herbiconiux sp. 11R-BC TaxID=3111637 RepID=UPI003C0C70FC
MDWSIQEVARLAGTTSRTLRHYAQLGIVEPSRVAANGYRYYDEQSLVRLQRVLLLRELGLGLPAIAQVLERETDAPTALRAHLDWLRAEQGRLNRQIASVRSTIDTMEKEGELMPENMFDGFDHTAYEAEVTERWGAEAYRSGDEWWSAKTPAEKKEWQDAQAGLAADWRAAAEAGLDPAGAEGQALARRQYDWLAGVPGTPRDASGGLAREYLLGLGELYVADERFAANYGGASGAVFVRDALVAFAEASL